MSDGRDERQRDCATIGAQGCRFRFAQSSVLDDNDDVLECCGFESAHSPITCSRA